MLMNIDNGLYNPSLENHIKGLYKILISNRESLFGDEDTYIQNNSDDYILNTSFVFPSIKVLTDDSKLNLQEYKLIVYPVDASNNNFDKLPNSINDIYLDLYLESYENPDEQFSSQVTQQIVNHIIVNPVTAEFICFLNPNEYIIKEYCKSVIQYFREILYNLKDKITIQEQLEETFLSIMLKRSFFGYTIDSFLNLYSQINPARNITLCTLFAPQIISNYYRVGFIPLIPAPKYNDNSEYATVIRNFVSNFGDKIISVKIEPFRQQKFNKAQDYYFINYKFIEEVLK